MLDTYTIILPGHIIKTGRSASGTKPPLKQVPDHYRSQDILRVVQTSAHLSTTFASRYANRTAKSTCRSSAPAVASSRTCKIRCRDWSPVGLIGDICFMYRSLCYTSMVGRAGASQDAPVSDKAGKTNSVRSATSRLVSWVVV